MQNTQKDYPLELYQLATGERVPGRGSSGGLDLSSFLVMTQNGVIVNPPHIAGLTVRKIESENGYSINGKAELNMSAAILPANVLQWSSGYLWGYVQQVHFFDNVQHLYEMLAARVVATTNNKPLGNYLINTTVIRERFEGQEIDDNTSSQFRLQMSSLEKPYSLDELIKATVVKEFAPILKLYPQMKVK